MDLRTFDTADDLAVALVAFVAEGIAERIETLGAAAIALSGGRTPTRFFRALSAYDLDWERVTVTLVDERWVPETSERSNAALLRANLMQGRAAAARFVPLYADAPTPEEGMADVDLAIAELPLPFAAVVLGMGDDGHTASFFPGGDRLAECLDPEGTDLVLPIRAPAAGEPRVTFTLPQILASDRIALHIEGAGKRAVLEAAMAEGDIEAMPIRAVLWSATPPTVFWCP